jgi:hypothetical protein
MRYSNSGYVLLGALIEHVSGQPLAQFPQRNIPEPRPGDEQPLEGLWALNAQRELGLAGLVDLGVEDLVIQVCGGLRLKEYVGSGCVEYLIVLGRTGHR